VFRRMHTGSSSITQAIPLSNLEPEMPESVVADDVQRTREYCAEAGCRVVEISSGNWCRRVSLLCHQDLMIAVKE
jgi:hypothetical protein